MPTAGKKKNENRCLDAFVVALNQASRRAEWGRWYTSTRELQLASLGLCRVCRSVPTLHARVSEKTPRTLWSSPSSLSSPPSPSPAPPGAGCWRAGVPTRVPVVRAVALTWELPLEVLVRGASAELWRWSSYLQLRGSVLVTGLGAVAWPKDLRWMDLDATSTPSRETLTSRSKGSCGRPRCRSWTLGRDSTSRSPESGGLPPSNTLPSGLTSTTQSLMSCGLAA